MIGESLSRLFAPLMSGDDVRAQSRSRTSTTRTRSPNAEVRLLNTLAGSLSVALENARLFDETQRLLTETNERAAELAIINSVQQGLAAKLDMQAMYELVGDKIPEIFDAQVVESGSTTSRPPVDYPYGIGRRPIPDADIHAGFGKLLLETRQAVLVNDVQGS